MKKLLVVIAIIIIFPIFWYNAALGGSYNSNQPKTFTVKQGEHTAQIADELEHEQLISSALAFKIYFYFHKASILAGDYVIEPQTKNLDLIAQLTKGKIASREFNLLVREGLTVKEINDEIKKQGYLLDDSFLAKAKTHEGYLFPDTYRLFKDFTADDLVKKMQINLDSKLTPELRAAIFASGHSIGDIIIMASILEKEVRTEVDMKIVSGIFWNRMKVDQALQSDATLSYALNSGKLSHSLEETKINSPYNTYKYPGLPPGPISNPGLMAIRAAIYPTDTSFNYFLNRPDTGETIFSRTLEEHNAAKAKYLK